MAKYPQYTQVITQDITTLQNDTFKLNIYLTNENGTPGDPTAYDIDAQIRDSQSGIIGWSSQGGSPAITKVAPAGGLPGRLEIRMSYSQTTWAVGSMQPIQIQFTHPTKDEKYTYIVLTSMTVVEDRTQI